MKSIIRSIVFSFIALYVVQACIKSIDFGDNKVTNKLLLVLGLSTINFLAIPALKIIGFKMKGLGSFVFRFLLISVMCYFLIPAISGLKFVATTIPELKIYDFVLPSKSLAAPIALIFTALMFSGLYSFLDWLCPKKG